MVVTSIPMLGERLDAHAGALADDANRGYAAKALRQIVEVIAAWRDRPIAARGNAAERRVVVRRIAQH
jgi:hypothetical protein